jgi:hypothetical protein
VTSNLLTFTGDGGLLVAVSSAGISYVDPVSLKVIGSAALPEGGVPICLGAATGVFGAAAGNSSGRLFRWVHQQ